ncbi:hypothetical protein BDP27DRAFT_1230005, partial [Rhodocollybia butyracea]
DLASHQAAGYLHLSLNESQKSHIKDDPCAIWTTLQSLHQQKKPGTHFTAYDTLFGITKDDNESLLDLAGHVSKAVQSIRDL